MSQTAAPIVITEVAPRDGLQSFPFALSLQEREALVRAIAATGLRHIEIASFVHHCAVPQHAGAEALCDALADLAGDGIELSAYVPNSRGLQRALRCEAVTKVGFAIGATDELTLHNTRMTTSAALDDIAPMVSLAREAGVMVLGAVSAAFGCPFTGPVEQATVLAIVERLLELGVDVVQLADTIGTGTPADVSSLGAELIRSFPGRRFAWHFHDTFGMGLANALTAARLGFTEFDSSIGGIGGCPFAPGAAGNVATEELLYALRAEGTLADRADLTRIAALGRSLRDWVDQRALSKIARVGELPWRDRFLTDPPSGFISDV
jgi:hydroxymethylglutaryl-CoA lyase